MARRRTCTVFLSLLAVFLVGTLVVLSTVSYYLSIAPIAYITEQEVDQIIAHANDSYRKPERIPRILHQTWRSDTLPDRWQPVAQHCKDLMPDYEYMLWTDAGSREFIATEYPWFLTTFDSYTYPIQRADAIRYFILHKYGGVYLDLDVGCIKRLDPLLTFSVILPRTIPVGVSNDLMFAEKNHPFMEQTIHNLISFDHSYVLNYPTVMFSTGPMFVSAQYGIYTAAHPGPPGTPGEVRILPKSLYGKNAKPGEAPNSFFEHHYGSSWHADDAAFITFLGRWGKILMYFGAVVVVLGFIRVLLLRRGAGSSDGWRRRLAYPILLPRSYQQRSGNFQFDFAQFSVSTATSAATTRAPTPASSEPSTPIATARIPVLPLTFEVRSPSPSELSNSSGDAHTPRPIGTAALHAVRQAGLWAWTAMGGSDGRRPRPRRTRSGVLYFLPAFFAGTSPGELDMPLRAPPARRGSRARTAVAADKRGDYAPLATAPPPPPPPPYEPAPLRTAQSGAGWSSAWEEGWSPQEGGSSSASGARR